MWPFTRKRATTENTAEESSISVNAALLEALTNPDAMTLKKAMNIPAFAGCVNRICDTVSIIPIRLYGRKGDSVEEVKDDDRVRLLNDDTRDTLSGADFKKAMTYDYLTNKGGYAFINHRGSRWYSLNYVDADYISFMTNTDHIFKKYDIQVDGKIYKDFQFLKFLRKTKDGHKGTSIIDENKWILSVIYNSILFENTEVKTGGNKRGYLQSDKKLSQEAINQLKESYSRLYSNDSIENVVVLNEGLKFQEASATSVELQLNENKKQNGIEVCKLFEIPPAIVGGGATAADWTAYIQYCIIPILETFVSALNRDLLLEEEKDSLFFAPDVTELTKADIKTRYEAYGTALKSGWIQTDEVRNKENLPSLGLPFVKLGLQDVLLNPSTGSVYTPNTGKLGSIHGTPDTSDPTDPNNPSPGSPPQGDSPDGDQGGDGGDDDGETGKGGTDNAD